MLLKGTRSNYDIIDVTARPFDEFLQEVVNKLLLMSQRSFETEQGHIEPFVVAMGDDNGERLGFWVQHTLVVGFDLITQRDKQLLSNF